MARLEQPLGRRIDVRNGRVALHGRNSAAGHLSVQAPTPAAPLAGRPDGLAVLPDVGPLAGLPAGVAGPHLPSEQLRRPEPLAQFLAKVLGDVEADVPADVYGGSVTVDESRAGGARFVVTLPAATAGGG